MLRRGPLLCWLKDRFEGTIQQVTRVLLLLLLLPMLMLMLLMLLLLLESPCVQSDLVQRATGWQSPAP
jgi:hypothetical protein